MRGVGSVITCPSQPRRGDGYSGLRLEAQMDPRSQNYEALVCLLPCWIVFSLVECACFGCDITRDSPPGRSAKTLLPEDA